MKKSQVLNLRQWLLENQDYIERKVKMLKLAGDDVNALIDKMYKEYLHKKK